MKRADHFLAELAHDSTADAARAVRDAILTSLGAADDAESLALAAAALDRRTRAATLAGVSWALSHRALPLGPHALSLTRDGAALAEMESAGLDGEPLRRLVLGSGPSALDAYELAMKIRAGELRVAEVREAAAAELARARIAADAQLSANRAMADAARAEAARLVALRDARRGIEGAAPPGPPPARAAAAPIAPVTAAASAMPHAGRAALELGSQALASVTWSTGAALALVPLAAWLRTGALLRPDLTLPRIVPGLVVLVVGVLAARRVLRMRAPAAASVAWDERGITERQGERVRASIAWSTATRALLPLHRWVRVSRRRSRAVHAGDVVQLAGPDGARITLWSAHGAHPPTWLLRRKAAIEPASLRALLDATASLPAAPRIEPDREARRRLAGPVAGLATLLGYGTVTFVSLAPFFGWLPEALYVLPGGPQVVMGLVTLAALGLRALVPAFELASLTFGREAGDASDGERSLRAAVAIETTCRLAFALALGTAVAGLPLASLLLGG